MLNLPHEVYTRVLRTTASLSNGAAKTYSATVMNAVDTIDDALENITDTQGGTFGGTSKWNTVVNNETSPDMGEVFVYWEPTPHYRSQAVRIGTRTGTWMCQEMRQVPRHLRAFSDWCYRTANGFAPVDAYNFDNFAARTLPTPMVEASEHLTPAEAMMWQCQTWHLYPLEKYDDWGDVDHKVWKFLAKNITHPNLNHTPLRTWAELAATVTRHWSETACSYPPDTTFPEWQNEILHLSTYFRRYAETGDINAAETAFTWMDTYSRNLWD